MKTKALILCSALLLVAAQAGLGQALVGVRPCRRGLSRIPAAKRGIIARKTGTAKDGLGKPCKPGKPGLPSRGGLESDDVLGGGLGSDQTWTSGKPIRVLRHLVRVTVLGGVAVTEVEQVFDNPNSVQLEGTYVVPIPCNAVVDGFSIWMNGAEVRAEALERKRARRIYDGIVRKVEDPGLVELDTKRKDLVRAHIFPIPARGEMRVKMRYVHSLRPVRGTYRYVYPLASVKAAKAYPVGELSLGVRILSREVLSRVWSPSHKVSVVGQGENNALAWAKAYRTVPRRNFELYYRTPATASGFDVYCHTTAGGERFFLAVIDTGKTAVTNPSLSFHGIRAYEVFHNPLPKRLAPGRRYLVVGRLATVDGEAEPECAAAILEGTAGGRASCVVAPLYAAPELDDKAGFSRTIWAKRKIRSLEVLAAGKDEKAAAEARSRIEALGKTFGVVTRLTSLLAK